MVAQPKIAITLAEYLARERTSDTKHEYSAGEIFAMAGASRRHNIITANVIAELHSQLKQCPCTTYPSDMRVKVQATGLYAYPHASVACGQSVFDDSEQDTLQNPIMIVEVLSKSTEPYDRGEKFQHYRKLSSLQEYILIAQDTYHIEHYVLQPDNQWLLSEADRLEGTIQLPSISCSLALADVYAKVGIVVRSGQTQMNE